MLATGIWLGLLFFTPGIVLAVSGLFSVAPSFDSNVFESAAVSYTSFGARVTGRLGHNLEFDRFSVSGDITSQLDLESTYFNESKLVISPKLSGVYQVNKNFRFRSGFEHFQKSFRGQGRTYTWSRYDIAGEKRITHRLSTSMGAGYRLYRIQRGYRYAFTNPNLNLGIFYQAADNLTTRVTAQYFGMRSEDYPAFTVDEDSLLVPNSSYQRDSGFTGVLRIRYTGRIIMSGECGYELRTSNSVLGEFAQFRAGMTISGRLSKNMLYHLAGYLAKKRYATTITGGRTQYRDPEQPAQNRLYLRIERKYAPASALYFQISYLNNETLVNRVYYNKALVEIGFKYSLH